MEDLFRVRREEVHRGGISGIATVHAGDQRGRLVDAVQVIERIDQVPLPPELDLFWGQ